MKGQDDKIHAACPCIIKILIDSVVSVSAVVKEQVSDES